MNSCEKNARIVCRMKSVDVTRVIPSRYAISVATVDLPVPVAPPTRMTIGRSSSRSSWYRRSCRSASRPSTSPRVAMAMLLEPVELDDVARRAREVVADAPRERVRAIGRDADRHQRPRHQAARVRQPVLAAERQRHDPARLRSCPYLRRHEREERLVEPGRDDLVVGEHDAGAALERMLRDHVDRGRLDLDEERVRVDASRARRRARRGGRGSATRGRRRRRDGRPERGRW